MGFELRLEEEAAKGLMALPGVLRKFVYSELRRLAENPRSVSRRASFPHPLDGQLFDAKCGVGGVKHYFTVMFKYSTDESAIEVHWIVHQHRP